MFDVLKSEKGDVAAMRQFVVLGIFILIGVVVFANVYTSAWETPRAGLLNSSIRGNVTVTTSIMCLSTPVISANTTGVLTAHISNYTIVTNTPLTVAITDNALYTSRQSVSYSCTGAAVNEGNATNVISQLTTTWYNAVNLLIIVFVVIAAVVILAYVGKIGGGGQ